MAADAWFPLHLPRLHPSQELVHLTKNAQEHQAGHESVRRDARRGALRERPPGEVHGVAGDEHPARGLQRRPRPRADPLLAVDPAHHPGAEREDDGESRLGQAPVEHRPAADDERVHPAEACGALAGEPRPPERVGAGVVRQNDGVEVEAGVKDPGHGGRLQHRVPEVAVGLVPESQRRRLQRQQQCRAELREREHGVDPLPLGERQEHHRQQEWARRHHVLPPIPPAAAAGPADVQYGECGGGNEAVRGEGGDERADGGGVVAGVGAVAVVVVGACDEVRGLLQLPPRALEDLPRDVAAAMAPPHGCFCCRHGRILITTR